MATPRISRMKRLCSVTSVARFDIRPSVARFDIRPSVARFDIRPSVAYPSRFYHTRESGNSQRSDQNSFGVLGFNSHTYSSRNSSFSNRLLGNSGIQCSFPFAGISPSSINRRFFASGSEGKGSIPQGADIVAGSGANGASASDSVVNVDEWMHKFKEMLQSTAKYSSEKVKEASDEVSPHVQQLLDAHPYLRDVIVPVSCTLAGVVLAWSVLPRLFRRFHKYSVEGPGMLFPKTSLWRPVSYEHSFWGALENPVRYFVTLMAFLQIGLMVAPNAIASQYATQACTGAFVVSVVWFLHRWKTNVVARALAANGIGSANREQFLALDRISSVGLLFVGTMALAEAFGVAVQSVMTVGGIGGVATAFAARDVLGNVLSGLSIKFSEPFSIGETIKAGSVEGQVVEMGLTTTSLLTAEKFPVIVPNSLFSSQVIVNKSRAKWRSMVHKIPLQIDDVDKISKISEDIKSMLRSNTNVFLEKEAPYCYLSLIERSYAELTLGCNLKQVSKEAEQDILLQAVRIIKQHSASLGSTRLDTIS